MDQKHVIDQQIAFFAEQQQLPASFIGMAKQWYWPLSGEIAKKIRQQEIKVLGISGTQGSGKSTLASLLCYLLSENDHYRVVSLSLDDFYLTRAERQTLAKTVHPLFITRGVPGTHDIGLAIDVITALLQDKSVLVPRFDKATDDRRPLSEREKIHGPVDLVILEGWCLAVPPQQNSALIEPVNTLESEHDADRIWRGYINQKLQEDYPALFELIDCLIYLKAPNFDAVRRWRGNQEHKLAQSHANTLGTAIMDEAALDYFLQHYQRLTEHSFNTLPGLSDIMFILNEDQDITQRVNRA